ncbi:MAG: DUF1499 domain-containing protein [Mariprofundales bacterium]
MTLSICIVALAIAIVVILAGGIMLAIQSQQTPALGLIENQLRPCPSSPNCVCSEGSNTNTVHYIAPIADNHDNQWSVLTNAITKLGGTITSNDGQYLHATFSSKTFHFIDDLEARRDTTHRLIHWRAASRVGHSDLGVNRQRVETLRQHMRSPHEQTIGDAAHPTD